MNTTQKTDSTITGQMASEQNTTQKQVTEEHEESGLAKKAKIESLVLAISEDYVYDKVSKLANSLVDCSTNEHNGHRIPEDGSIIDIPNEDGMTALMMAAKKGKNEIVQLLPQHGANVNTAPTKLKGMTVLMYACDGDCSQHTIEQILNHHPDINVANKDGMTALMFATRRPRYKIIQLLLQVLP